MLVGLLPTYAQAGPLAPALLVALRLVQGFAVAGEISGASSMILEHAPLGRRGFFASFTLQGVQAGQIMAAAVFLPLAHYMPADAFLSWGWRVPFLLSVVVIIAGYFIRRNVEETPVFAEQNKTGVARAPALEAIKYCWPDMVRVMCVALMNTSRHRRDDLRCGLRGAARLWHRLRQRRLPVDSGARQHRRRGPHPVCR